MIRRFLLLTILSLLASAYSPKEQFQKDNHGQTLRQDKVDSRSVIGGAQGGGEASEIQREEEEENTLRRTNCEEAQRVCGFREYNPEEL